MAEKTCELCRWWDSSIQSGSGNGDDGVCRVLPPRPDERDGRACWPFTLDVDWCRAFEVNPSAVAADAAIAEVVSCWPPRLPAGTTTTSDPRSPGTRRRARILGESIDAITAQAEDAEGRLVASRVARERAEHDADNHRAASIRSGNENYALRVRAEKAERELSGARGLISRGKDLWCRMRGQITALRAEVARLTQELADAKRARHILSEQAHDHAAVILAHQEAESRLTAEAYRAARNATSDEAARLREALMKARGIVVEDRDASDCADDLTNLSRYDAVIDAIDAALSGAATRPRPIDAVDQKEVDIVETGLAAWKDAKSKGAIGLSAMTAAWRAMTRIALAGTAPTSPDDRLKRGVAFDQKTEASAPCPRCQSRGVTSAYCRECGGSGTAPAAVEPEPCPACGYVWDNNPNVTVPPLAWRPKANGLVADTPRGRVRIHRINPHGLSYHRVTWPDGRRATRNTIEEAKQAVVDGWGHWVATLPIAAPAAPEPPAVVCDRTEDWDFRRGRRDGALDLPTAVGQRTPQKDASHD